MRLLLIDREYPPNPHGGIGSYDLTLAKILGQLGHFVVVLSSGDEQGPPQTQHEPYGVVVRLPYRPISDRITRYLRGLDDWIFGQKFMAEAIRLVQHYEVDLVEIPSAGGYGAALANQLQKHVPVITRFHGALGKIPIDNAGKRSLNLELQRAGQNIRLRYQVASLLNLSQWLLERHQLIQSRYITCPSNFSHQWLSQQTGLDSQNWVIIPNGVDMDDLLTYRHAQPNGAAKKVITFIGRCNIFKGAGVLARAAPSILDKIRDAVISFVGPLTDPQVMDMLSDLIQRYPNRIKLWGRLPHAQVMSLLAQSYVLVHPTFYEISPIATMEAMALGVPVIASNLGPLPEIVKNGVTGILFQPGNEEALAEAAITLLNSSQTHLEMSQAALTRAKTLFDLKKIMAELIDFYQIAIVNEVSW